MINVQKFDLLIDENWVKIVVVGIEFHGWSLER